MALAEIPPCLPACVCVSMCVLGSGAGLGGGWHAEQARTRLWRGATGIHPVEGFGWAEAFPLFGGTPCARAVLGLGAVYEPTTNNPSATSGDQYGVALITCCRKQMPVYCAMGHPSGGQPWARGWDYLYWCCRP